MKVIKIVKLFEGSKKTHNIVVSDELDNEEIESAVIDWCEEDISCDNYGWTYTWEVNANEEEIDYRLRSELRYIEDSLKHLNEKKLLIEKHLNITK